MPGAVIFDMDGVLVDTEKWLNRFWRQAAAEAGYDMTREHALAIRSLAGPLAREYLKGELGADFPYERVRARRKELMEAHVRKNGLEKKPGVDEALDYLGERGIARAVATATDPARAGEYLDMIGAGGKMDCVIGASMVKRGKPAPDIYLYACERLGQRPGDCVAVEDSPNGVRSAASAGLATIMVPDLTEPDPETERLIAARAESLFDLVRLLEEGRF